MKVHIHIDADMPRAQLIALAAELVNAPQHDDIFIEDSAVFDSEIIVYPHNPESIHHYICADGTLEY